MPQMARNGINDLNDLNWFIILKIGHYTNLNMAIMTNTFLDSE